MRASCLDVVIWLGGPSRICAPFSESFARSRSGGRQIGGHGILAAEWSLVGPFTPTPGSIYLQLAVSCGQTDDGMHAMRDITRRAPRLQGDLTCVRFRSLPRQGRAKNSFAVSMWARQGRAKNSPRLLRPSGCSILSTSWLLRNNISARYSDYQSLNSS